MPQLERYRGGRELKGWTKGRDAKGLNAGKGKRSEAACREEEDGGDGDGGEEEDMEEGAEDRELRRKWWRGEEKIGDGKRRERRGKMSGRTGLGERRSIGQRRWRRKKRKAKV